MTNKHRIWAAGVVGLLALGAAGCGSAAAPSNSSGTSTTASAPAPTVHLYTNIITGKMDNKPGWPMFTPANMTVPKGAIVHMTIISWDDGTAPPQAQYAKVTGVQGDTITADNQTMSSVPVAQIAHTFTVPALGINIPVPATPTKGTPEIVKATFIAKKAGSFQWLCEAPCGTGSTGFGGPMATPGWMQGTLTVSGS